VTHPLNRTERAAKAARKTRRIRNLLLNRWGIPESELPLYWTTVLNGGKSPCGDNWVPKTKRIPWHKATTRDMRAASHAKLHQHEVMQ
jgi:hypothetical protein